METITPCDTKPTRVERRLRAYLECLGVDDPEAMRRLIERVLEQPDGPDSGDRPLEEIFRSTDVWFQALAVHDQSGIHEPLVGWRLRGILQRHPEAILCPPSSQDLDASISDSGMSMPIANQADMPPQPLGDIPKPLQISFWQGTAEAIRIAYRQLIRRFARE